jgi:hypothetical protein
VPYAKSLAAKISVGTAVVFGDFSGVNGLSRAAVYDATRLRERHSRVVIVDIGRPLGPSLDVPPAGTVYLFCQPDMYQRIFARVSPAWMAPSYRVGRWVWETPHFPESWRFAFEIVHEIWAPSEFCGSVFRAAGDVPVRVVPHAVTPPPDSGIDMRKRLSVAEDAFMGLTLMDITSCPERKNPWAHVVAWKRAFVNDPHAVLVLKVRTGKRTKIVLRELQELIGSDTNIRVLTDELSEEEIGALQRGCDAYLSLHRSEGYGLTVHEALLCGKLTIATNWSANAEYGPGFANYRGVDFDMVRYRDWTAHYDDTGFHWAEASVDHAGNELRAAFSEWKLKRVVVATAPDAAIGEPFRKRA